jgi:hypothetical protein
VPGAPDTDVSKGIKEGIVFRRIAVLVLAFGAFSAAALPALAAAPANDLSGGATLAAVGFSEVLDTTEATTDDEDAQLNENCGAPATDASVWYTVVGNGGGVVVDVSSSNYTAGVAVGVGDPGSLELVACGPGLVGFFGEPGVTYHVLAFDDQFDGAGNGGSLNISFNEAPPPPTVDITVNKYGTVNARTGVATISGTYTCSNGDFIEVSGFARQTVGRFFVNGFFGFFDVGTCDGSTTAWTAEVFGDNGKFAGGKAMTVSFGFSCGPFECAAGYNEQVVQLRGGRK